MKIRSTVSAILISVMLFGCATIAPRAYEDGDDGLVLVIEVEKIIKAVENWGFHNGFQYVAYRRIGTTTSNEWAAVVTKSGSYAGSSTVFYSKVLVKGIDNPKNAPEKFNVVTVPSKKHTELTEGGEILLGTLLGTVIVLLICIPIL